MVMKKKIGWLLLIVLVIFVYSGAYYFGGIKSLLMLLAGTGFIGLVYLALWLIF